VLDIRTTMQPGTVIKVDESEFLDLDRLGLVLEVVHGPVEPVTNTATVKVVSTSKAKPEPEEA